LRALLRAQERSLDASDRCGVHGFGGVHPPAHPALLCPPLAGGCRGLARSPGRVGKGRHLGQLRAAPGVGARGCPCPCPLLLLSSSRTGAPLEGVLPFFCAVQSGFLFLFFFCPGQTGTLLPFPFKGLGGRSFWAHDRVLFLLPVFLGREASPEPS